MRMGDRDRQRIRRIGRQRAQIAGAFRQQHFHHHRDLRLLRVAGAGHGLLDEIGRIFGDGQTGEGGDDEGDAARLAKLQGRLRVAIDEGFFDGRLVRRMRVDDARQSLMELTQPRAESSLLCEWIEPLAT